MINIKANKYDIDFELSGSSTDCIAEIRCINEVFYIKMREIFKVHGIDLTQEMYFVLTGYQPRFKNREEIVEDVK